MRVGFRSALFGVLVFSSMLGGTIRALGQANSGAVLVELFTSEGCSSCPPADELLRKVSGQTTAAGQLIVGAVWSIVSPARGPQDLP